MIKSLRSAPKELIYIKEKKKPLIILETIFGISHASFISVIETAVYWDVAKTDSSFRSNHR